MRAVVVDGYGKVAEARVQEVPDPSPGATEVLVNMRAAAINPFDLKLLDGAYQQNMPLKFPFTPGMDGAGVVEDVGADVHNFAAGDRVFGTFKAFAGHGSFAEMSIADAKSPSFARMPEGLEFQAAAAIPVPGLTAMSLLRAAGLQADEKVLVIGATGGIGVFLLPLAAERGAYIVATASEPDADYVHAIGAKETIDYRDADTVEEVMRRHPEGVDVVIDLVSSGEALVGPARAARKGGRLISPLNGPVQLDRGVSAVYVQNKPEQGDLDDLGRRVAGGRLRVEIGAKFPLDEAGKALSIKEKGHVRGKVVVEI